MKIPLFILFNFHVGFGEGAADDRVHADKGNGLAVCFQIGNHFPERFACREIGIDNIGEV